MALLPREPSSGTKDAQHIQHHWLTTSTAGTVYAHSEACAKFANSSREIVRQCTMRSKDAFKRQATSARDHQAYSRCQPASGQKQRRRSKAAPQQARMFTRKAYWAGCFLCVSAWQHAADFASAPMRVLSSQGCDRSTTLKGRLRATAPCASLSASAKGDFVANCLPALLPPFVQVGTGVACVRGAILTPESRHASSDALGDLAQPLQQRWKCNHRCHKGMFRVKHAKVQARVTVIVAGND
ncbi:hypothetical protein NUW54_g14378 [Trametes sanguinea]|uniref:Uncharacterized protein n=1 Tax=Trametes sanguinea TaxID=158606 RepID=A0ACC1MDP3_9APHY|nr:hypothetical protein NUW54_g14378 [Trametes sanguinea]